VTPSDLRDVLRRTKTGLAEGLLEPDDWWPPGQLRFEQPSFGALEAAGPWPDHIEYYFRCTGCRSLFRLSAETYHGAGGSWSSAGSGGGD